MGLQWVRLDTNLPRNHKILDLISVKEGYRTAFVFTCALAYCGEQGTDGFVPRSALPFIHARIGDMNRLVAVRLITPEPGGGGWNIRDWKEYQPSNAEAEAKSQRMRDLANLKWEKYNRDQEKRRRKGPPDA